MNKRGHRNSKTDSAAGVFLTAGKREYFGCVSFQQLPDIYNLSGF